MEATYDCTVTAKHSHIHYGSNYNLTSLDKFQKINLIGITITALLSLAPTTRVIGSLTLRVFALTSAISITHHDRNSGHIAGLHYFINILKIGAIALGILAIAISSPLLLIPAISIDLLFQAFQLIQASSETNGGMKVVKHFFMLTVDTLFLIGTATSSWPLMASAAAISILAMISFAMYSCMHARHFGDYIDAICYGVLAITGFPITAISQPFSKFPELPISGLILGTTDEMGMCSGVSHVKEIELPNLPSTCEPSAPPLLTNDLIYYTQQNPQSQLIHPKAKK